MSDIAGQLKSAKKQLLKVKQRLETDFSTVAKDLQDTREKAEMVIADMFNEELHRLEELKEKVLGDGRKVMERCFLGKMLTRREGSIKLRLDDAFVKISQSVAGGEQSDGAGIQLAVLSILEEKNCGMTIIEECGMVAKVAEQLTKHKLLDCCFLLEPQRLTAECQGRVRAVCEGLVKTTLLGNIFYLGWHTISCFGLSLVCCAA